MIPAGGWPTFALTEHRPQWMKIQVQQWRRRLEWVETVSSPESVTHTVGGRDPNVYCQVYIDDGLVSSQTSDANGDITFTSHLKAGDRHVKVLFWDEPVTVQVLQGGHPLEGAPVYLFSPGGTYLGHHGVTDGSGEVSFLLPVGESFEFRADLLGSQYFSGAFTVTEGAVDAVVVDTTGGTLTVNLDAGDGNSPMSGIKTFLFSGSDTYLGLSGVTENGTASFDVPRGTYKIRADYLGYQYWTDPITLVDENTDSTLTIEHQSVEVTVLGAYVGDVMKKEGLNVYLFTEAGAYQGIDKQTDSQGHALFSLPPGRYKFRADYLNSHHLSEVIDQEPTTITIAEREAQVEVTLLGDGLKNVPVYVFDQGGAYLGLTRSTDSNGIVAFRLPQGVYDFRADFMGSQFFADNTILIADQINPIQVDTGGADFTLFVEQQPGTALPGVTCFLFSPDNAYLGDQKATNSDGEAPFKLPDGSYKVRIDHLGHEYWTKEFSIPTMTALTKLIDHQNITVTVQTQDDSRTPAVAPLAGVETFLFTANDVHQGISDQTDSDGYVPYTLPPGDYKIRVDYLNEQYWAGVFNHADPGHAPPVVTIPEGTARIQVLLGSSSLEGSTVYVYDGAGVYLGINDVTDGQGVVDFQLPAGNYKFRVDFQSNQHWVTEPVAAHQINDIEINTGGGTFDLTVQKGPGNPLINVPVYVFSSTGSYLGMTNPTDSSGKVSFELADGGYKFRADYMGYQFWTGVSTVPIDLSYTLPVPHTEVTVTVDAEYDTTTVPIGGGVGLSVHRRRCVSGEKRGYR